MKRILCIAVSGLVFVSLFSSSVANAEYSAPELVVAKYCKADMKGARIGSDKYPYSLIEPLLLSNNELGWDTAVLIKEFKLLPSKPVTPQSRDAQITVEYSVIGKLSVDLTINEHTETYTFHLKKVHGKWKIDDDPAKYLTPHIKLETAIENMESIMHTERKGEPEYQHDEDIIRKLKKLQGG